MTRGRSVAGPTSWLLREFERVTPSVGRRVSSWWLLLGAGRGAGQRPGPDLVEAGAAVDGPVVPWREGHDRLAPTRPANRGMELPWSLVGSGSLGNGPAGWASLRVIDQPFRVEEGLLAGREDELLAAITAGQTTVLVHPLQTLLARTPLSVEPAGQAWGGSRTNVLNWGRTFVLARAPARNS